MIKKLSELSKDEKILLLKGVADKEIEPDQINEKDTLFAIKRGDLFTCVMGANENKKVNIVCLGLEAKEDQKIFASFKEKQELNFIKIKSGLYRCKENGKEITEQQIKAMEKDYLISIQIVDDLKKPTSGYMMVPKSKDIFIGELKARK